MAEAIIPAPIKPTLKLVVSGMVLLMVMIFLLLSNKWKMLLSSRKREVGQEVLDLVRGRPDVSAAESVTRFSSVVTCINLLVKAFGGFIKQRVWGVEVWRTRILIVMKENDFAQDDGATMDRAPPTIADRTCRFVSMGCAISSSAFRIEELRRDFHWLRSVQLTDSTQCWSLHGFLLMLKFSTSARLKGSFQSLCRQLGAFSREASIDRRQLVKRSQISRPSI